MVYPSKSNCPQSRQLLSGALLASLLMLLGTGQATAQEGNFTRSTIDIGVVVNDLEASLEFYTEAIGFLPAGEIICPPAVAGPSGLTDDIPFRVEVLALGDEDHATRLKLIEMPEVESAESDNAFIHSQLGYSYLTLHVVSTEAALKRLESAGIEPLAEGPVALGDEENPAYLTLVRDPDGNIVELVGPMNSEP